MRRAGDDLRTKPQKTNFCWFCIQTHKYYFWLNSDAHRWIFIDSASIIIIIIIHFPTTILIHRGTTILTQSIYILVHKQR